MVGNKFLTPMNPLDYGVRKKLEEKIYMEYQIYASFKIFALLSSWVEIYADLCYDIPKLVKVFEDMFIIIRDKTHQEISFV